MSIIFSPAVLLRNTRPGWVLPAAGLTIDFNFAAGLYYGGTFGNCISLTRASPAIASGINGTLYSFDNNIPAITNQGWQIMEARTNKCTNYNANPPALVTPTTAAAFNAAVTNMTAANGDGSSLWGVVDDAANVIASGLGNISNGRVYKVDNSSSVAAATVIIGGITGNTNTHTISVWARSINPGGSGLTTLRFAATSSINVNIPASSSIYTRVSVSGTPTSTDTIQIRINAGATVYFVLNDLEEGSFVTQPIVVAGASAARAADVAQLIGPAATVALNARAAFIKTSSVLGGTQPRLVEINNAAGSRIFYNSSTQVSIFSNPNQAIATIGGAVTYATTVKSAYGFDSASMTSIANAGTKATTANAWDATSAAIYIGNRAGGDRALNGFLQELAFSNIKGVFDAMTA